MQTHPEIVSLHLKPRRASPLEKLRATKNVMSKAFGDHAGIHDMATFFGNGPD